MLQTSVTEQQTTRKTNPWSNRESLCLEITGSVWEAAVAPCGITDVG
jgi:hypothetical protein